MEFFAIIVSLLPAGVILAVTVRLVTRRRARRRHPPGVQGPPGFGGRRGGPGPVREPRRPLSPAGAGSAAVAPPEDEEDSGWWAEPVPVDPRPAVPERRLTQGPAGQGHYLAYSMARCSRITITLICPGYWSSSSIRLAMSRAITSAPRSSTWSGLTMTRTSRPACIA